MFGSTWGNNQNQQQPGTSAFGQPSSAFGSTPGTTGGAFGSTSAFGQPAQQQQQQQQPANPMFGNLGGTGTANTASTGPGFGSFGGTSNTSSAFGAPKPATGFGAFGGGTSAFGSTPAANTTSAFGRPATNTSNSVFGQPAATTSAFGSTGTGLFGNTNKTSAFGTTPLGGTSGAPPTVTTGSSNPAYATTTEKDGTTNLQFQSISCMPAYLGYSFDELRVQDYSQNRKTASTANTFGGTAFGAGQPAQSAFGQPAQPTTSLFGNTTANTNPTGGAFGAFGQPAQQQQQQQPAAGTSLFGNTGTSAFGQPQQQQQQPNAFGGGTTGAFGQQQQQQQQQQPQQSTGLFGGTTFGANNNAAKPFGTFGGTATTTTPAFGTGTSAFGNPQQNQQPAQTGGLFGNTQPTNPGTNTFGGIFGNTNNAAKPGGLFGNTAPTTQPAANPFGTFGTQQQQPQQQTSLFGNAGGGLFGNTQQQQGQQQQQQPPQTTGLFGNTQQNTGTPSLFGNTAGNTGGGLFGNTQANQQGQQQAQQPANPFGGLFGPKPAQPTGTGLFGNTQAQQPAQQNTLFGKSLFNSTPAAPGMGTSMSTTPGVSSNLFGQSMGNAAPQPSLTASIAQPIGDNLPIFDMLPPGPRIVDLDSTLPKKKAGFFTDIPTRSPVPRVQLGYTPANSKLRGFGSSTNMGSPNWSAMGISLTNGKPGALALNKSDMRASSVGPDFLGRSGSPALGSGARQSVKKVILDKKVDPSELFVKTNSPGGSKHGRVTFSAQLSVASRERDAQLANSGTIGPIVNESPTRQGQSSGHRERSVSRGDIERRVLEKEKDASELEDGDYYVKPDLTTLKKAGYDELSAFSGLIVGRKNFGEIHFLEPVDLTGLPKLGALLGEVIRFDVKECSVYPDVEESDKPAPGSGLNVRARIILVRCWPQDKATREPVKDASHPVMAKHTKRLKAMKNTHFESWDIESGTWTFTVDHF